MPAALAVSLAAAACGGGGGGGSPQAPTVERYAVGGTVSGLAGGGLVLQNNGADDLVVNGNGAFHFAAPVQDGAPYAVTVKTQPAGQTCSVSSGSGTVRSAPVTTVAIACAATVAAYRVGGTAAGLAGPGLVLRNGGGDDLAVDADGVFTFATPVPSGGSYAVTVAAQPPGRFCTVSRGFGTVAGANVASVAVVCSTTTFRVGGAVTGLSGPGLVLQDNGADDLAVTADGAFTFATSVASGATYEVTVKAAPPGQRCTVSGATGTASANVTTVSVTCSTLTFTVGGSVTGLVGAGLVLRNLGGDDLAVDADGAFVFATSIAYGGAYAVTVRDQPPDRRCTVGGGVGTVTGTVSTVIVSCGPIAYTVGGTVTGLGAGGLVLRNRGADDLTVGADGAFTFRTALSPGDAYDVTVGTQPPGQRCTVTGGTGTVAAADVTSVSVTCAVATFAVRGSVSGLAGAGLVLQDNGGDDLAIGADGPFAFALPVAHGAAYHVTVLSQPLGQLCAITGGDGTVAGADVTTVSVTCAAAAFRVGGSVSGLTAAGLVLANGLDTVGVSADGPFTFATQVPNRGAYAVTVSTQPAGQRCSVAAGDGTVAGADVDTVRVTCVALGFFAVSGTVTGVPGPGLVLRDNGSDDLAVDADGAFTFATRVMEGEPYAVSVASHPARSRCAVASGAGTVSGADVTTVVVTCHHWTAPAAVRTGGGTASAPALAFGPSGDAVAVWIEVENATTSHVYAAQYSGASGTWGAATRIDHPAQEGNASAPDVAVDGYVDLGEAVAVWRQEDAAGTAHVWSARMSAAGAWATAERIDTGSAPVTSAPRTTVDGIGNALVIWTQRGSGSFENVWSSWQQSPLFGPSGWGTPVRVDTSEAGDAASPRVVYCASGIAYAAWQQSDGTRANVWGARWTNGARWTGVNAPVLLESDDTGPAVLPELAVDESGNAFVAWQQPEPGNAALLRVWAAHYDAHTGWGAATRLDTSGTSMRFADVATDATSGVDGSNAFAVWREQGSAAIRAARFDRAGATWSAPSTIGGGVSDPAAKLISVRGDARGDALAVWQDGSRIRANHFTLGAGSWDGELQVDTGSAATAPVVRFDGAGNAVALWIEDAGGGAWQVMSARFR